jgi:hypothetical protein
MFIFQKKKGNEPKPPKNGAVLFGCKYNHLCLELVIVMTSEYVNNLYYFQIGV